MPKFELTNPSMPSRWFHFGLRTSTFGLLAAAAAAAADLSSISSLLTANKLPEAAAALAPLAAATPNDPEVNFYLGELALRRKELEKATAFFEKASAAAPTVSRYQRRLGDAWGTQAAEASIFRQPGLAKKCLAAYERAVVLDPKDIDARLSVFEFYRRAPALFGGGFEKSSATAQAIKDLDPARGRVAFATLYVGEKQIDKAFAEFDAPLKANPDDYTSLYQIGRLAAMTGQFVDRGVTSLRRCLELPAPTIPTTPGHAAAQWRLGQLLEKKSDLAAARASYEAAIKLDPNFAPAAESLKKLPTTKK